MNNTPLPDCHKILSRLIREQGGTLAATRLMKLDHAWLFRRIIKNPQDFKSFITAGTLKLPAPLAIPQIPGVKPAAVKQIVGPRFPTRHHYPPKQPLKLVSVVVDGEGFTVSLAFLEVFKPFLKSLARSRNGRLQFKSA